MNGGRTPTGWMPGLDARKAVDLGAGEILLTSMDADGTQDGYDHGTDQDGERSGAGTSCASGGAGTLEHFYQVLTEGKADAVLAASVFHYRKFTIKQSERVFTS